MIANYYIKFNIVDDIVSKLESMGYIIDENDVFTIGFAIMKTHTKIKNICGINSIPDELHFAFVELSLGDILHSLKASGKLNSIFNLGDGVKTVNIGDTSITFDASSADKSVDSLINCLLEKGELDILCYRKLRW